MKTKKLDYLIEKDAWNEPSRDIRSKALQEKNMFYTNIRSFLPKLTRRERVWLIQALLETVE